MAMRSATIGIVTAVALVATVLSVFGGLVTTRRISSTGNVRSVGVGVYFDLACTNATSTISWGSVDPGTVKSVTVYVRDEGNSAVVLNVTTANWSPTTASSSMTLSWNRESYVLSAGSTIQAILTLTVSASISGITSFSFDITITGTAQ